VKQKGVRKAANERFDLTRMRPAARLNGSYGIPKLRIPRRTTTQNVAIQTVTEQILRFGIIVHFRWFGPEADFLVPLQKLRKGQPCNPSESAISWNHAEK